MKNRRPDLAEWSLQLLPDKILARMLKLELKRAPSAVLWILSIEEEIDRRESVLNLR